MTLKEIIENLSAGYWIQEINTLLHYRDKYIPNKVDLKLIISEFEKWLKNYKRGRVVNWAIVGLIFYHDQFLSQVRKKGLLRPSKYSFISNTAGFAISEILKYATQLCLPKSTICYLESFSAMHELAIGVNKKVQRLSSAIRNGKDILLKGMLVTLDFIFMTGCPGDKALSSSKVDFYTKEQLAEGFSYFLYLYHTEQGVPSNACLYNFNAIHDECIDLLIDATKIRIFQEFEILVDALDYSVSLDRKSKIARIIAPTPELEKACRLGYILVRFQKSVILKSKNIEESISLEKMGSEFYKEFGDIFVDLKQEPIPRYVFQVPKIEPLIKLITQEHLFEEECLELEAASKDFMVDISDILKLKIISNVSLCMLLKVHRLFNFIRWYTASHFMPLTKTQPSLVFQSLVPSFTIESIQDMLISLVESQQAECIIDFLTWTPKTKRVFDIQYQPLVKTLRGYLVPMNILASSDIIRNSLLMSRIRFYPDGTIDPLSSLLAHVLRQHTNSVAERVQYDYEDFQGDIDTIALFDNILFVFECKNSLIPCNSYEIRTSYDSIVKGATQLTKFQTGFNRKNFRKYIENKLGWHFDSTTELVTCIVVGNRMFTGYRINGHAIRASYSLVHFIKEGTCVNQEGESICFWVKNEFTSEDLRQYIVEDLMHRTMFDSMEQYIEQYSFGKYSIEFETYYLDALKLKKGLGFKSP